jgi:hypothetical protein
LCGFSGEGWNPATDVRGSLSLLFQMTVGRFPNDKASIAVDVPQFISKMIEVGFSNESRRLSSFWAF